MTRKSPKKERETGKGPLELIAESIHALRTAPPSVLICYFIGSLPFVLGLLYFWADMSKNAFAELRLVEASLVLTLLFFWMKCWQGAFMRRLIAHFSGGQTPRWSFLRLCRMIAAQVCIQSAGLLLLPLALLFTLPFCWAYAFFQNASLFGNGDSGNIKVVVKKAWEQSCLWPKQNHLIVWILSPWLLGIGIAAAFGFAAILSSFSSAGIIDNANWFFFALFLILIVLWACSPLGFVVAGNIGVAIVIIPYLLHTLFGMETQFSLGGIHSVTNTTFIAVVYGISYLCLDPLMKATYALRCFYGESVCSGADLKSELNNFSRRFGTAVVVIIFLLSLVCPLALRAETESSFPRTAHAAAGVDRIDSRELDRSIETVINKREYSWQLPRKVLKIKKEKGFFAVFLDGVLDTIKGWLSKLGDKIQKLINWLKDLFPKPKQEPTTTSGRGWDWQLSTQIFVYVLIVILTCTMAVVFLRLWKNRRFGKQVLEGKPVISTPDLSDENTTADLLPSEQWLAIARELMAKGELRLALRALYMACLAQLAERGLLIIEKYKSNREYLRELTRRAHNQPDLLGAFSANVNLFERSWYGKDEVTQNILSLFETNQNRIDHEPGRSSP